MDKHPYSHPQDKLLAQTEQVSVVVSEAAPQEPSPTHDFLPAAPDFRAEPKGRKKEQANGKR
jgi:hypothetical protein